MPHYDFDKVINRRIPGDIKYEPVPGVPDVLPLWVADMDFQAPPAVQDALIAAAKHGIFGYTNTDEEYDSAVISWFQTRMNWKFQADHILKMPGVIFAIASAIRGLSNKGDSIMICQPVYHPFANVIRSLERNLVVSELRLAGGRYEMDFEDLENKIIKEQVKVFLFCSPHNPVGRVWTKEELLRIGKLCIRHDVLIISDEIHADFVYPGSRHIPLASLSDELSARCITCTAPSKTFNLAGLQAANTIITNPALRSKVQKAGYKSGYSNLSIPAIVSTKAAYQKGGEWLDALLSYLQENIALVEQFCIESEGKIRLIRPEGTYLLWLDCRALKKTPDELEDLFLKEAGVRLNNGAMFGAGGSGFMRMNIACPKSTLKEALARMKQVL